MDVIILIYREHSKFEELDQLLRKNNWIEEQFLKYEGDWERFKKQYSNVIEKMPKGSQGANKNDLIMGMDGEGIGISSPNSFVEAKNFAFKKKVRYVDVFEHRHEYIEMIYVHSGTLAQMINGKVMTMKQGEICILDTGARHSSKALDKDSIVINVILTPSFFDGVFMSLLSDNNFMSNFIVNNIYSTQKLNNYVLFQTSENQAIQDIMLNLLWEYHRPEMGSSAAINGYFLLLFTELSRSYEISHSQVKIEESNSKIKKEIIQHLRKEYKEATLSSVAGAFHFHPSYLSNLIKKEFGKNFKTLLTEIRLKQACNLLENSEKTIEEIVFEVGYTNASHFYRLFKKHYGSTPYEYRKKCHKT